MSRSLTPKEHTMKLEMNVYNMEVNVELDEGHSFSNALEVITCIKTLVEELEQFENVKVSINSNINSVVATEEDHTEDHVEDHHE